MDGRKFCADRAKNLSDFSCGLAGPDISKQEQQQQQKQQKQQQKKMSTL
jgi:hypothetical protein